MTRLAFSVLLLARIASAADACAMISPPQVTSILGTTSNTSLNKLQLPPKATDGKACEYRGREMTGTVIMTRFESPAAAQAYLQSMRTAFEKQPMKTTTEKFGLDDGFSFPGGMLAVRKNTWLRVNVNPPGGKSVNLELTRKLMLAALQAN